MPRASRPTLASLTLVALAGASVPDDAAAARPRRPRPPKEIRPERLEFGVLPAINYDSDLGFGFGAVAGLAKFKPGFVPYRWRLELLGYATVRRAPGKGFEFPFHDDYLLFDVPGLAGDRLRLGGRVGFRRFSNTGYYGLGNDSRATEPWLGIDPDEDLDAYQAARRFHRYDHIYPQLLVNARIKLWDRSVPANRRRLEALVGLNTSYNIIRPYPGSKLEQDIAASKEDTPDGKTLARLLHGTDPSLLLVISLGLLFDTRNHEYTPTRGTFTELSTRTSPGVQDGLRYAAVALNSAWYKALVGDYLSIAARQVVDVIAGDPPLYETTRFGALIPRDGPGGGWSLRGVPRQRYAGKIKLITNFELRSMFWRFNIRKSRFLVGAIAFVDAARIWADFRRTELAGASVDGGTFKVGTGGGLRIRWGETFVVRADGAYSPTEGSSGFYVDIGQVF